MNVVCRFSLGPTTAKNYLKAGISAEFQPFRNESKSRETTYIIMQYTNKFIS